MYLKLLNKKEKEMFLGLAYNLAVVDNIYSEEEKKILLLYSNEMELSFDEKTMINSTEKILKDLNKISSEEIKKIIIFELIGLAISDGEYDENEKKMINNIAEIFQIPKIYMKKCEDIIIEYQLMQKKINTLILGR